MDEGVKTASQLLRALLVQETGSIARAEAAMDCGLAAEVLDRMNHDKCSRAIMEATTQLMAIRHVAISESPADSKVTVILLMLGRFM